MCSWCLRGCDDPWLCALCVSVVRPARCLPSPDFASAGGSNGHPGDGTAESVAGIFEGQGNQPMRDDVDFDPDRGQHVGLPHFVATPDGEAIVQITGTGPTTASYVDPAHSAKK